MVNERGQIYTIEGIAASVLLLVTAYFVLGATSTYTPGETHVNDLQLKQIANDILTILDTSNKISNISSYPTIVTNPLENFIDINLTSGSEDEIRRQSSRTSINSTIWNLLNNRVDITNPSIITNDTIFYYLTCVDSAGQQVITPLGSPLQPRQNTISASRLVYHNGNTYLIEMVIWRN